MNIWQFQQQISRRLLRWSLFSIVSGLLLRSAGRFWRSLGGQFVAWGVIDAAIALFGTITTRSRAAQQENPGAAAVRASEARNLGRILWLNAGLDVLYILGGWLLSRRDKGDGRLRGTGWGVILQGLFLLVFDVFHALKLPDRNADR